MKAPRPGIQERLVQWWWIQVPLRTARHLPDLGRCLADGLYLVRWPRAAAVAPPLALLLGILSGVFHPGETFTRSLALVGLLLVVGAASAQLGAWAVAGYALGDFLLRARYGHGFGIVEGLARERLPLLIAYFLLAMAVVGAPWKGALARAYLRSSRIPERLRLPAETLAYAATAGVLTYAWTQAVPVLIRPVFTWPGGQPETADIAPLQTAGWTLAGIMAASVVARVVLERRAAGPRMYRLEQVVALALPMAAARGRKSGAGGLPARAAGALGVTLLLAGLIPGPLWGLLVFAFFGALLEVRSRMRRASGPGMDLLARVPVWIRLAAGLAIGYAVSRPVVGWLWNSTQTLLPVLLSTCISVAIATLLTAAGEPTSREPSVSS